MSHGAPLNATDPANGVANISEAIYANALCLDRLLAYAVT